MKKLAFLLIPVFLLVAAIWLRWGYKKSELTFTGGPVDRVTSTETETILHLNQSNELPVVISDSEGTATIKRTPGVERIILNQKRMETDQGQALIDWKHPVAYVPARKYRVFSGGVYLGRLEMENGGSKEFILPKP